MDKKQTRDKQIKECRDLNLVEYDNKNLLSSFLGLLLVLVNDLMRLLIVLPGLVVVTVTGMLYLSDELPNEIAMSKDEIKSLYIYLVVFSAVILIVVTTLNPGRYRMKSKPNTDFERGCYERSLIYRKEGMENKKVDDVDSVSVQNDKYNKNKITTPPC